MICCAVHGPTPGKVSSSSRLAVLTLTTPAGVAATVNVTSSSVVNASSTATGAWFSTTCMTVTVMSAGSLKFWPSYAMYSNVSSPAKPFVVVYVNEPSNSHDTDPAAGPDAKRAVKSSPSGSLSLTSTPSEAETTSVSPS